MIEHALLTRSLPSDWLVQDYICQSLIMAGLVYLLLQVCDLSFLICKQLKVVG